MRVSFPGRAGDLLWACSVIKAIAAAHGPVDLRITGEFAPLIPLLQLQPYLKTVEADSTWPLVPPREWEPPSPREGEIHLGYRGWPDRPLPQCIYETVTREYPGLLMAPLDLETPWMSVTGVALPYGLSVGFTESWLELKVGLLTMLDRQLPPYFLLVPPHGRWMEEVPGGILTRYPCRWIAAAQIIRNSDLFFGDCSALHVLAVALGKRAVIMEPMVERHNPIFWPLGTHDRVQLVRGNDGLGTTDVRHCADAIKEALDGQAH